MTEPRSLPNHRPAAPKLPLARIDSERACLALLADLETNLRSSQAALLSRAVVRTEQLTAEQAELRHGLSTFLRPADARVSEHNGIFVGARSDAVAAAQAGILHLGRVQSALLRRALQSLRVISHLLAEPQSGYGPPLADRGIGERRQEPPSEEASPCLA